MGRTPRRPRRPRSKRAETAGTVAGGIFGAATATAALMTARKHFPRSFLARPGLALPGRALGAAWGAAAGRGAARALARRLRRGAAARRFPKRGLMKEGKRKSSARRATRLVTDPPHMRVARRVAGAAGGAMADPRLSVRREVARALRGKSVREGKDGGGRFSEDKYLRIKKHLQKSLGTRYAHRSKKDKRRILWGTLRRLGWRPRRERD